MFEDDVKVVANYMAKTGKAKRKLQRDLLAQIKLTNTIKNGFVLEKGKDIYERHMIGYAEAEDDKLYVCIFDNFKTKEIVRECEKVLNNFGPKLEELEALE